MKNRKLYIILTSVVALVVAVCLAAALIADASKSQASMEATVITASNRIRSAIIADPDYISVEDDILTTEPNRMYMSVAPAIIYTPRKWLASLNLPQRWDMRLTGMFPSEIYSRVHVFVYNASLDEMGKINQKIKTIDHLSEIRIRIQESGVMPSRDQSPIMLKGQIIRDQD